MERTGESGRSLVLVVMLVALAVVAPAVPAVAADTQATSFDPGGIVFPVIGEVTFTDTFGEPRSGGRTHDGIDLMGVKGQPVVAAAAGTVRWIGDTCCYLAIDHGGGWETWYIHLDNDTPGTDDGLGWGIAEGIEVGATVAAGQLIGWLGDSGNAEWTTPHLHFEIRSDGTAINPYSYLLDAPRLDYAVTASYSGQFSDDDGSVHEADIDRLYQLGITRGCNADGVNYCPLQDITRGEMAAFIRRTLDLPAVTTDHFADDTGHQFEADINAITAAGIGFGCSADEYCPDTPLLREEMAELLVRAFQVPASDVDRFIDDDENPYESAINALAAMGITNGCDPDDPGRFCPQRPLTRAEMASFFIRSLDWQAAGG